MNSLPFLRREACYPSISVVFVLVILIFIAPRKKCPYLKFFWPIFSRIWTEYRDMWVACIYKLHFLNFDNCSSSETRQVFLDISKAFERIWNDGLFFKLKQNGVRENPLGLI